MHQKIIESNNSNLTNDSFKENRNIDIFDAQERTFNSKKINIIIIAFIYGKVIFSKYHPGKFLVAWHPKSSEEILLRLLIVHG